MENNYKLAQIILISIIEKLEASVSPLIFGERGDSMGSQRLSRTRNWRETLRNTFRMLPGDSQVSRVGLKRGPKMKFNVPHMVPMVLAHPESESAVRFGLRRKKIAKFCVFGTFCKFSPKSDNFALLETLNGHNFQTKSDTKLILVSKEPDRVGLTNLCIKKFATCNFHAKKLQNVFSLQNPTPPELDLFQTYS